MLKLKILIVDDSVTIRKLVEDAFEKRGYRVIGAASGEEALDITLREHPDLVISDISMPGMDGWDLCSQVRKNPYTSFIPFVFLSAKAEAPDRIKGLQMGADDYITKPFDMTELVARVEMIFNRMVKAQQVAYSKEKGLSGSTKDMALPDLLQMFQSSKKTGVLKISKKGSAAGQGKAAKEDLTGKIAFFDGNIISASLKNFHPIKALQRMLGWDEAKFELEPLASDSATNPEQRLAERMSVEELLLENFRVHDELEKLKKERPLTELAIIPEALKNLKDLTDAQKKVLLRTRRVAKMDEILEIEELTDLETYETVIQLVDGGFLSTVQ